MTSHGKNLTLLLILILALSIPITIESKLGIAQSGTNVSGIIAQDTIWTQSNGPYNFTADVTVAGEVTLTIEPGTEVYINAYTFEVNGTLHAVGTSDKPIIFASAIPNDYSTKYIMFSQSSTSWNSQSNSGSIIQYDKCSGIQTNNASPKIDNNQVQVIGVFGGSPIISNNVVTTDVCVGAGNPIIYNNTFNSQFEGYPSEVPAIDFNGPNNALVYDNHFSNGGSQTTILVNQGSPVIERNFIAGGIAVCGNTAPVIENNTIATSSIGLNIYDSNGSPSPTIAYNNFEQNTQYNIYLGQQGKYTSTAPNINAANNWWGTTDISVINQTIYDHKDNFNLGTVTFTPILTASNPEAMPNPNAPTPTPNPTQTTSQPTSTSSQNNNKTSILGQTGLLIVIAVLAAVIVGLTAAFVVFWRRTKLRQAKTGS